MAESLFEVEAPTALDSPAIATGHAAVLTAWEEGPGGKRRPTDRPEEDELGRRTTVIDVLLPFGRDGQPLVFGVRVLSKEATEVPAALAQVEFDGLRMRVRQHRSGKGVDVSFTADAVRPAGAQGGRRRSETEAA